MGKHGNAGRGRGAGAGVATVVAALALGVAGVGAAHADEGELVPGTPCRKEPDIAACVTLDGKQAWLIEDDVVVRGPVPISHGGQGRETPRGNFRVEWKHADHKSAEFDGAPMPWAVFFAPGGIAFHQGNLKTNSAGCVRLGAEDAKAFYEFLQVGDGVQVV
jgi:L,D-transpeptidase catalytic domain